MVTSESILGGQIEPSLLDTREGTDMLDELNVDNVFLYIADAVRADFAPERVLNKGINVRTIAAGIHSPTSIASIVSGTYLPQHGVGDFTDTLPSDTPNILHSEEINTGFANTMNDVRFDPGGSADIIANTLDVEANSPEFLSEIEPPFVFIERGPGGHAPYVQKHELDTGDNYFRDRGNAHRSQYSSEYQKAVTEDADWFLGRLEELAERGLLEDTLVIYTSDHGELLGEQGMLAHSPPIHPRHVYVPTVLIHPQLDVGHTEGGVLRHVDIVPTIASLLGVEFNTRVQPVGIDLTNSSLPDQGPTFYAISKSTPFGEIDIAFDSAWDTTGGYVFPKTGRFSRLLMGGYHMTQSSWSDYTRAHPLLHMWFQLRGDRCHWAPRMTTEEAKALISDIRNRATSQVDQERQEVPKERLRELGYME